MNANTPRLFTYYKGCAINVWREPADAYFSFSIQHGDKQIQGTMAGRSRPAITRQLKRNINTSAWHRIQLGLQDAVTVEMFAGCEQCGRPLQAPPAPKLIEVHAGTIADIYDVWPTGKAGRRTGPKVLVVELKVTR